MSNHHLLQDALPTATDIRQVVIGADTLASVDEVFRQACGDRSAIVIADENTFDVAGRAAQLRDLLRTAGCPTAPEEFTLDRTRLKASYAQARQIRCRYTVFDPAAEPGVFAECVDELFEPGGF